MCSAFFQSGGHVEQMRDLIRENAHSPITIIKEIQLHVAPTRSRYLEKPAVHQQQLVGSIFLLQLCDEFLPPRILSGFHLQDRTKKKKTKKTRLVVSGGK